MSPIPIMLVMISFSSFQTAHTAEPLGSVNSDEAAGIQGKKPTPTPTPTPPPNGPDPDDRGGPKRSSGANYGAPLILMAPNRRPPSAIRNSDDSRAVKRFRIAPKFVPPVGYKTRQFGSPAGAKRPRREASGVFMMLPRSFGLTGPTPCHRNETEEDLSGTYFGNVEFPNGGLSGTATLNIDGRQFTLIATGQKLTGQLAAETTCNYTAVAMRFENAARGVEATVGAFPLSISVRAIQSDNALRLLSVPGEIKFRFTPAVLKD